MDQLLDYPIRNARSSIRSVRHAGSNDAKHNQNNHRSRSVIHCKRSAA
jgi:hypothetical protein